MRDRSFHIIIFILFLGWVPFAQAWTYEVKPGESLSVVAFQYVPGPIWGAAGSLKQILVLNPRYQKNPNFIRAGDSILLPDQHKLTGAKSPPPRATRQLASASESAPPPAAPPPAAPPPAAPTQVSDVSSAGVWKQQSLVSVAPMTSFSRIDSVDNVSGAHAVFGSDMNFGAELAWRQYWTPRFRTALGISGESMHFESSGSTRALDNSNLFLGKINFEAQSGEETQTQYLIHAGATQTPFVVGESASSNVIDAVAIPYAGVGILAPIYSSDIFLASAGGSADYLAAASQNAFNVNSGYALTAVIQLEQFSKYESKRLSANLYFRYANQNTSLSSQQIEQLGGSLKWSFDFFGGRP